MLGQNKRPLPAPDVVRAGWKPVEPLGVCPELQLPLTLVQSGRVRLAVSRRLLLVCAVFRVCVFGGHLFGPPRAQYARLSGSRELFGPVL